MKKNKRLNPRILLALVFIWLILLATNIFISYTRVTGEFGTELGQGKVTLTVTGEEEELAPPAPSAPILGGGGAGKSSAAIAPPPPPQVAVERPGPGISSPSQATSSEATTAVAQTTSLFLKTELKKFEINKEEELVAKITIESLRDKNKKNIDISYTITDSEDNLIHKEEETRTIEDKIEFIKVFKLPPGVKDQEHKLSVQINYKGEAAFTQNAFKVTINLQQRMISVLKDKSLRYKILSIAGLAVLLIIIIILIRILRKPKGKMSSAFKRTKEDLAYLKKLEKELK